MKKLTDTLKKMLNALAHQHAGEHLTNRQKAEALGNSSQVIEKMKEPEIVAESAETSTRRQVALYTGSELPAELMSYVIETCTSLQHDLTVLSSETKSAADALLEPYKAALNEAGIKMQLVTLSDNPINSLTKYLKGRPEIAFLACKENGYLGRSYLKGPKGKDLMPVPVVVVAAGKGGAINETSEEKADSTHVA